MRRNSFTSRTGLVLVFLLAIAIAGCSDHDKSTSSTSGGFGISEDYSMTQGEVNAVTDSVVSFMGDAFGTRVSLASGGIIDPVFYVPIDDDSDNVGSDYNFSTGWHVVSVTRLATSYESSWIDSVQFRNSGGNFQHQGATCDQLTYRHRFTRSDLDTTDAYYNRSGVWSFTIEGFLSTQVTANGTIQISTEKKYQDQSDSTIVRTYEYTATMTDLVVNRTSGGWNSSCPESGTVTSTVNTTYKRGSGDTVSRTWTVTVTFDEGNASIHIESGNREWDANRSVCYVVN